MRYMQYDLMRYELVYCSTLSVIGWCSGRGSGSPLMRTFAGSKPLLATFLATLCPICPGPYLQRQAADGSGKTVDSPIAPSLHTQSQY
jgi:hypothetical protein